jgi:hypothetical protein
MDFFPYKFQKGDARKRTTEAKKKYPSWLPPGK